MLAVQLHSKYSGHRLSTLVSYTMHSYAMQCVFVVHREALGTVNKAFKVCTPLAHLQARVTPIRHDSSPMIRQLTFYFVTVIGDLDSDQKSANVICFFSVIAWVCA